ncbi:MAG: transketolase [Planctomycetota bacterium]
MAASDSPAKLAIDTIRTLSMDAVQAANSGHPGTPMALAPVMYRIWDHFLQHHPADPDFPNRDRFVLSVGHASMLLYSTLHLTGYDLSLDDIKSFRQLHSPCAGHPEFGECPGVETTTGPLGQGCGNTVGMAIAQKHLAARYNRPGHDVVTWRTIALCGDGDLMEGVTSEAASLAGHLGLDNLVWVYDDNSITIEGSTDLAFGENVQGRFEAYGWQVLNVADANDLDALDEALESAEAVMGAPVLIIVKSHIGYGAPNKQDTSDAHGAPLGVEEIAAAKKFYGWDPDKTFYVPTEVKDSMTNRAMARGKELVMEWEGKMQAYRTAHPELAAEFEAFLAGDLPEGWDSELPTFAADAKGMAGRGAFGQALNASAGKVPWLMGGSADLASSNKTNIKGEKSFLKGQYDGRNMHFGVREHAMGSIANGMALAGLRAYTGTFFVFSDYMRPAHRLSGLMELPVIYVYTHDSIGVGEDGPTHQPIEHLPSLRAIPNLDVIRPGDANEVVEAWRCALEVDDHPVALLLSRQAHPTLDRDVYGASAGLQHGAYVLADNAEGEPDVILIGSGSELGCVVEAYERLDKEGVKVRAVSMPCWEIFERQDAAYREGVLPPKVRARVAIEAASPFGWERYVGLDGCVIGREGFGASAPGAVLFEHFKINADAVVEAAHELLAD